MPPFEILRPLGKGAMGAVYEVRVPGDPRRLVAKMLTSASPNAKERFEREGELVARLDGHPGIVSVHSHGVLDDGAPYLLFDLVEGTSLFQLLRQAGVLPLERVIEIGRELSAALAHAHANGIVHRDVKPENILIDPHGRVRLTDFGLGLAADQLRLTRSGVAVGTPLYMAPEQLSGKKGRVGPWTDVHAVGLVLAECLRGTAVFHGDSSNELASIVANEIPPPLGVEPGIDAIVACCLEKSAEERYPHAGELQKDLERLALGQTPEALSDRKQRTGLILAIAACVLLGASLIAVGALKRSQTPDGQTLDRRDLLLAGEASLIAATERLSGSQVGSAAEPLHEARLGLERTFAESPSRELRLLISRHLALEAEVALLAGDTSAVPELLKGADREDSGAGPDAHHVAALRAGLVTLSPQEGDDLVAHVQALTRASRLWPQRVHFRVWKVQLAVRAGQFADAVDALEGLAEPARVPVGVRFAAYLGAGDVEQAKGLAEDITDPALVGGLYYRLSLDALGATDLSETRANVRRALRDAPDDPLRAELLAKATVLVSERSAWDPDSFGNAESLRLLRWEVDARLIFKELQPGHRMLQVRADDLRDTVKALLTERGVKGLDTVAALVSLNPGYEPFEREYLRVAGENDYPNQDQALEVLKSAYARATGGRRGPLTVRYVMALRTMGRLEPFFSIAERVARDDDSAKTGSVVYSVWGDTLRMKGRPEEAREKLARSMKLDPSTPWPHSHMFRLCRDQGQSGPALEHAWGYLERVDRGNPMLPRMESERVHEAVSWIEANGELADAVRALRVLTEIKTDAIHAASRSTRLLCDRRSATQEDLDRLAKCIAARAARVKRYAKVTRLDMAKIAPLLRRLEAFQGEVSAQMRAQLEAGEFDVLKRGLLRLEKALPAN